MQVNPSARDVETMTLQNAALVEQSSAAAQDLQAQAATLSQLVSAFTVLGTNTSRQ